MSHMFASKYININEIYATSVINIIVNEKFKVFFCYILAICLI